MAGGIAWSRVYIVSPQNTAAESPMIDFSAGNVIILRERKKPAERNTEANNGIFTESGRKKRRF